jgi:hypothetical protein
MGQVKIYPSTQAQVQAVQDTVDEINAKIPTPTYQVKTVTPSNVQQTVQADPEFTALSGVVVNPQTMPENLNDFIMNTSEKLYDIELEGMSIPSYAFYSKNMINRINGDEVTSIGLRAFESSTVFSARFVNATSASEANFYSCNNLHFVDIRKITNIDKNMFASGRNLEFIDLTARRTPPSLFSMHGIGAGVKIIVNDSTDKSAFQAATNWSAMADRIYTVAEIEALVGMTYDEYYLQCFGRARNEVTP